MQLTRRLDSDHDMTFGQGLQNFARNSEACAANVQCRLLLLLEEWYLDTSAGVPYLQEIATRPVDPQYAISLLKDTVATTEDVASIVAFDAQFDSATRTLTLLTVTIVTIYGDTVNIQVVLP